MTDGKAKVSQVDWCFGARMTAAVPSAAVGTFSRPWMRHFTPQIHFAPWIAVFSQPAQIQYSGVLRMNGEMTTTNRLHGMIVIRSHRKYRTERG